MPDTTPLEQVDAIYRAAPIGLCVLDRELRYVRVNDHLAEINRHPVSDHLGRRIRDLLPEIADSVEPVLQRVLDTGEAAQNIEVVTPLPPHGSGRAVVMHCLPLRGAGHAVVGINVVVEDVTEQRRTAERLQTAERRLWLQTEHSPMAVIEWDAEYRVTRWGGAAESIFGWKAEEVLGRPISELNIVVEEDWPDVQRTIDRMNAAQTPHVVSTNRNYTRDRRVIVCVWYNSVVTGPDGGLASVLSLVADVTEQRRWDQEQQLLAQAGKVLAEMRDTGTAIDRLVRLPVALFADWCGLEILTPSGTIEPRAFAHADGSMEAELAPLHRSWSPDWRSPSAVVEVLRTGTSRLITDFETVERTIDDDRLLELHRKLAPTSLISVPLRVGERTMGAWTWGRSRPEPFTERNLGLAEELARRAATALLNAELFEAIERANRTKDQFLATLGHELRQPLGALTTALSLLAKTVASDNSQRVLRVASRQLDLVTRLVDDLLDLSRIERGKLVLHRAAIDLRQVVCDAAEANAHVIHERGQHLHLAVPDAAVPIVGDPARLQQVVSNLLSNASKFSAEGGRVDLTLDVHDGAGRIAVRDTGRGIARSALETIFEPFAQAGQSTGSGLGIGLAVVRQLVELHKGTVEARSAGEGHGSEFIVHLPLNAEPAADEPATVPVLRQGPNS